MTLKGSLVNNIQQVKYIINLQHNMVHMNIISFKNHYNGFIFSHESDTIYKCSSCMSKSTFMPHNRHGNGWEGVKISSENVYAQVFLSFGLVPFEDSPTMSWDLAGSDFGAYSPESNSLPAEGVWAPLISPDWAPLVIIFCKHFLPVFSLSLSLSLFLFLSISQSDWI